MSAPKPLQKGDRVSWNTPQGRTQGRIVERRTSDFTFADQDFIATEKEPAYIVESEKSGKKAAHQRAGLRKITARD